MSSSLGLSSAEVHYLVLFSLRPTGHRISMAREHRLSFLLKKKLSRAAFLPFSTWREANITKI